VCYAASLRGESPSLVELKATTENLAELKATTESLVYYWIEVPDQEHQEISFNNDNTVLQLKQKIRDKFDIPVDNQELVWEGQTLSDYKKLKDYSAILSGATFNVVLK